MIHHDDGLFGELAAFLVYYLTRGTAVLAIVYVLAWLLMATFG